MIIIDGKKISQNILAEIKTDVETLSFQPVFCDVLVGNDRASMQYVDMKMKKANSVGVLFHKANFLESINTEELVEKIQELNKIQNMCGIIVQLPLPNHIDTKRVLDAVDPEIDVDCLGAISSKKFYNGENIIGLPTAAACMQIIDSLNLDLKEKKIIVLGQGNLVGKPVTRLLQLRGFFPYIIDSKTENKKELLKEADVIISGIGKGGYLTKDLVKKGVILIDAGTSESYGSIIGDVDVDSVKDVAEYLSPVPGGVGPVTVSMLLKNILLVAKNRKP